jgi:hypothetical protein
MKRATMAFSALLLALGIAMVVRTAAAGAGADVVVGYVFGAGLIAAGALRLYLAVSRSGA